ncbi:MAG: hypothetical protein GY859_25550 [Desulfobacterales bacterium]|nr:hypothetical protein [Desulfobacterales bacterium]
MVATPWENRLNHLYGVAINRKDSTDMDKKGSKKRLVFRLFGLLLLFCAMGFVGHEVSLRYFQSFTCGVCHEMREPVRKWEESGTALNHGNCAGCHGDAGFDGWMAMNKSALNQLVEHFKRDPKAPIKPPEEPLFLEDDRSRATGALCPTADATSARRPRTTSPSISREFTRN